MLPGPFEHGLGDVHPDDPTTGADLPGQLHRRPGRSASQIDDGVPRLRAQPLHGRHPRGTDDLVVDRFLCRP